MKADPLTRLDTKLLRASAPPECRTKLHVIGASPLTGLRTRLMRTSSLTRLKTEILTTY